MTIAIDVKSQVGRLTFAAFAGTVLIGGSNFVAVKLSNLELAPLYGAAVRFTAAAVIFARMAKVLSLPFPRGRALLGGVLYGALPFGASYGTASATAYSFTLMPIVAVAVGAVVAHEPISVEVVLGAVLVLFAVYVGALKQPSRGRGRRTDASVTSAR